MEVGRLWLEAMALDLEDFVAASDGELSFVIAVVQPVQLCLL